MCECHDENDQFYKFPFNNFPVNIFWNLLNNILTISFEYTGQVRKFLLGLNWNIAKLWFAFSNY
jgi:hypothetical protein